MISFLNKALCGVLIVLIVFNGLQAGNPGIPKEEEPFVITAPDAMIHSESTFRNAPILDLVLALNDWNNFFNEVEKHKNVVVVFNGPGGFIVVLDEFKKRIRLLELKGIHIHIIVTKFVASADAMAICEVKNVTVQPGVPIIYHMKTDGKSLIKDDEAFEKCQQKGYITKEEVEKMDQGFEVWVTFDKEGKRHVVFKPDSRLPEVQLPESTQPSTP